jgi:hypothetical protein
LLVADSIVAGFRPFLLHIGSFQVLLKGVENRLGEGATFRIVLPVPAEEEERQRKTWSARTTA